MRAMSATDTPALYTITVRGLCEFTAKQGHLDRRFSPTATALEGMRSHQLAASRRGEDYESELPLQTVHAGLCVRGRADGYDPRRRCLEEFKAIRGTVEEIPENRRHLHWAQLLTYAALFCREKGVDELAVSLVYIDVASQAETEMREVFGAQALEAQFQQRCEAFMAWARQEAAHRARRDAALQGLAFPLPEFRPGQRLLAEAVFRAARHGRCLQAQAPTGIGKTLGTVFPLLRGMPDSGTDKLAFLTCKGTGRRTAMQALQLLRVGLPGRPLRVLAMVPKEQACEHPGTACHPDACPLAAGFFDRLPAARQQAVDEGWLDAATQRRIALEHQICPYYLGQELVRWADALVGDVHHLFDPAGQLWALQQSREWRLAVLVDEAHNLPERARMMYSAELRLDVLRRVARQSPPGLSGALSLLLGALAETVAAQTTAYTVLDEMPEPLAQALQVAVAALADLAHRQPLAQGEWLDLYPDLQHFARLADTLGEHSLLDIERDTPPAEPPTHPGDEPADDSPLHGRVSIRNVLPAGFLRPRWLALQHATLFSATIGPPAHAQALLGLPDDSAWIDVPPAFPPENLQVKVAHRLSTRFADRSRSLPALAQTLARQYDHAPGNYLAFFSSFQYLEQAAGALQQLRPDIPHWRQDRAMSAQARQAFLERFAPDGRGIGFAVLGGVFSEGVDLPGTRLIGAFIATLGLPPVSAVQTAVNERAQRLLQTGEASPELIASMQKVVQAAGRVLRTPQDKGMLWLLDDRYARPAVQALLPAWWRIDTLG
jgi:DNA excision repair protein ERCC-2